MRLYRKNRINDPVKDKKLNEILRQMRDLQKEFHMVRSNLRNYATRDISVYDTTNMEPKLMRRIIQMHQARNFKHRESMMQFLNGYKRNLFLCRKLLGEKFSLIETGRYGADSHYRHIAGRNRRIKVKNMDMKPKEFKEIIKELNQIKKIRASNKPIILKDGKVQVQ